MSFSINISKFDRASNVLHLRSDLSPFISQITSTCLIILNQSLHKRRILYRSLQCSIVDDCHVLVQPSTEYRLHRTYPSQYLLSFLDDANGNDPILSIMNEYYRYIKHLYPLSTIGRSTVDFRNVLTYWTKSIISVNDMIYFKTDLSFIE